MSLIIYWKRHLVKAFAQVETTSIMLRNKI